MTHPVRAETGITIQSLRPISSADWLKMGLTSLTPIQSGMSCLLASTRSGTPVRFSLEIILSAEKRKILHMVRNVFQTNN